HSPRACRRDAGADADGRASPFQGRHDRRAAPRRRRLAVLHGQGDQQPLVRGSREVYFLPAAPAIRRRRLASHGKVHRIMATLSIALGKYPHTAALRDGSVKPDGIELDFVEIDGPIIGAFRRMVRNLEFDISEMAITTYLSAKEYLKPFTAIPVFPVREFPHRAIVVNSAAGINSPKDLEGKRVGVRAYTVTTGVWARGVLSDVYGVDLDKVAWVIADEEHVQEAVVPGNVESIPGADLGAMVASG